MSAPTPLPANSPRLNHRRVEVNISRPSSRRAGSWIVRRTGRFRTIAAARRWAEQERLQGERASITGYYAADGWQPHALDTLTDVGWQPVGAAS